ncbi:MAG: hypothetical protein HY289_04195 [Planctomycetes bacterium]|nr:hypothetical protein [Planctomycetota bacterium]
MGRLRAAWTYHTGDVSDGKTYLVRSAFEAEKRVLLPGDVNRVNDCITTIEKEAKEKEPDGSVIKSMAGKLVKVIQTSAKAVGLAKAGKSLWHFCEQWNTGS